MAPTLRGKNETLFHFNPAGMTVIRPKTVTYRQPSLWPESRCATPTFGPNDSCCRADWRKRNPTDAWTHHMLALPPLSESRVALLLGDEEAEGMSMLHLVGLTRQRPHL
jgi:hypothetical protein